MNAKYDFVKGDTKEFDGRTLRRIRALVAISTLVKPGDLGGYIEAEKNLSDSGDAWVSGNARVSDNAWVFGDALVSGDAKVYGNARVYNNAQVYGDARVYGDAWVSGDAQVSGNADYLLIGPSKSSGRFTTAHKDSEIGVRVNCGCFTGTVQEFSGEIEKTHANNQPALEQYRLFCQLIAFNFGVTGEQA